MVTDTQTAVTDTTANQATENQELTQSQADKALDSGISTPTEQSPLQKEYSWKHTENSNTEAVESFMEVAKSAMLTPEQLKIINEWNNAEDKRLKDDREAALADYAASTETALKKEWGENYEIMIKNARSTYEKIAAKYPDITGFMENTRLGDSPEVIKIFAAIGEMISEDSLTGTAGVQGTGATDNSSGGMLYFPSMQK